MTLSIYMDVHVKRAVTEGLRRRGVDVLIAQEDGTTRLADSALLERATSLGRVLFSQDEDLLIVATRFQRDGMTFTGLAYAHQERATIRQLIDDLELLAKASELEDIVNQIQYLPF
jgi:hypothetical protein